MIIKTILVDDEPLALAELKSMLKSFPLIQVIDEAVDSREAITKIRLQKPELLFLDINMPDKNGFDLLTDLDEVPEVVFVTAYDQFAIRAFDINALDYILKPVNPQRLEEAINKVKMKFEKIRPDEERLSIGKRIFIKDGEECFFVPLSEVFFIESEGNYVRVHYQDKKPLLHKSLNYLENRLPSEFFFRASRQQMFNVSFVKSITPYFSNTLQIVLQGGLKIDLSQRQSVKFKDKMGI